MFIWCLLVFCCARWFVAVCGALRGVLALVMVCLNHHQGCLFMRIICPNCQSKAVITSRDQQSNHVFNLYCSCTNTKHCGQTFVSTLSFSHTLNPPVKSTLDLAASLLRTLPVKERQQLLDLH
jgi:hypothetical protein